MNTSHSPLPKTCLAAPPAQEASTAQDLSLRKARCPPVAYFFELPELAAKRDKKFSRQVSRGFLRAPPPLVSQDEEKDCGTARNYK
jgi:hypothetical protein